MKRRQKITNDLDPRTYRGKTWLMLTIGIFIALILTGTLQLAVWFQTGFEEGPGQPVDWTYGNNGQNQITVEYTSDLVHSGQYALIVTQQHSFVYTGWNHYPTYDCYFTWFFPFEGTPITKDVLARNPIAKIWLYADLGTYIRFDIMVYMEDGSNSGSTAAYIIQGTSNWTEYEIPVWDYASANGEAQRQLTGLEWVSLRSFDIRAYYTDYTLDTACWYVIDDFYIGDYFSYNPESSQEEETPLSFWLIPLTLLLLAYKRIMKRMKKDNSSQRR